MDVKSVESTKTKAIINFTLIHHVEHPIHRKYNNVCLCGGDKLIRTWEDDHEVSGTYLHQCVSVLHSSGIPICIFNIW